jgi:putative CocE/NonD family hydrolase
MMKTVFGRRTILALVTVALWLPAWANGQDGSAAKRISEPGRYEGYSRVLFDGWVRTSQYVTVRDGTRIAIDLFRPTNKGMLHTTPLPVIWEHRRYQRASATPDGKVQSQLDRVSHPMRNVLLYGYIFAVAEVRGSGASFGVRIDPTPAAESLDAYDITEWLATQPWCNGRVGMYGISYSGASQFMAASTAPPHLKAIFPEMAMFDLYELCYPGGIFRQTLMKSWAAQTQGLDRQQTAKAVPVDEDKDGRLLEQAVKLHTANFDVSRAARVPYRDSTVPDAGDVWSTNSPSTYFKEVRQSKVAVYQRAGWFDMNPRDMLLWFCNLDGPRKIAIGPWNHYQSGGLDRAAEIRRWFDYWLKDIDNGIMKEPPIYYYVMGAPQERARRWADQWPLPQTRATQYYLGAGLLSTAAPKEGFDSYVADYTTTSGNPTRWTGAAAPAYQDMAGNDAKALTYTTESLTAPVEVVGHPIVHLWLQCDADDVDLFAYLEDVDRTGKSSYVTEGCLRASCRRLAEPPYDRLGLPYHRGNAKDVVPLPAEPVELMFDLLPTAQHFAAGHRIRIALACADKDSYRYIQLNPPPTIKVLHDAEHPSRVEFPLVGSPTRDR